MLNIRMDGLERRVDRIKSTLEKVTIAIEKGANDVVNYYLKQRGINIKTGPVQLSSRYEFHIYGIDGG